MTTDLLDMPRALARRRRAAATVRAAVGGRPLFVLRAGDLWWLLALPLALTASPVRSQEPAATTAETSGLAEVESVDDEEAGLAAKLSVHGYLTLGYGRTDGIQFLGLPEDGTTGYRNAALQLRLDLTPRDALAVQLDHESLGRSREDDIRSDVGLDWAVYQRHLGPRTSLRVGRVPIPFGIYNEVRDVGTLLPFYRPPANVYRQAGSGSIVLESIDGLQLSRSFRFTGDWGLSADVYFGGFDVTEDLTVFGRGFVDTRARDTAGGWLWLRTPIDGVRVGAGAITARLTGGGHRPDDDLIAWVASFEALLGRWSVRAEYLRTSADLLIADIETYDGYYVELGYSFNRRFAAYAQVELADVQLSVPAILPSVGLDLNDDYGVALHYRVRPELVLKLEGHRNYGFLGDNVLLNPFAPPPRTDYAILSLSTAF